MQALLDSEQLDGALVVTNHATHFDVARQCLARDLHVLVEKPLVLYADHGRQLVELARAHKRELIAGFPFNYLPFLPQAIAILHSGELGAIQAVNCQYNSNILGFLQGQDQHQQRRLHGPGAAYADRELSGGGHGHTQITHFAGLLFHVTRLQPLRVSALMANHGLSLDMVNVMSVQFTGDVLGTVSGVGNLVGTPSTRARLEVFCAAGALEIAAFPLSCTVRRQDGSSEELAQNAAGESGYPAAAPANNLVDVILGRAANISPGEVGWRAAELLDAAYRSAGRNGQPVSIKELYT